MNKRDAAILQRYMDTFGDVRPSEALAATENKTTRPGAPTKWDNVGNPVQRGHHFQRKADSNPVIADSG